MHWLDYLQWPAMLVTVVAAWLVASAHRRRRKVGFWVFLASNLLWIAWGLYAQAYALILLQAAFLQRFLGPRGLTAIERLAGMLLIMLSVDMLLDNLRSVLHIAA